MDQDQKFLVTQAICNRFEHAVHISEDGLKSEVSALIKAVEMVNPVTGGRTDTGDQLATGGRVTHGSKLPDTDLSFTISDLLALTDKQVFSEKIGALRGVAQLLWVTSDQHKQSTAI